MRSEFKFRDCVSDTFFYFVWMDMDCFRRNDIGFVVIFNMF